MNPQNAPTLAAPNEDTGASGSETTSGGALAQTKEKITQAARDAASKVKSAAADTAAKAKEQAERIASEKKVTTAERISNYSSAVHESARSLEEQDPNVAWFTHRAANKLQDIADYMRNRDFRGLRADAEDFARRHPAAFFGGLFIAGLALGNVVKASRRKLDESESHFGDQSRSGWMESSPPAETTHTQDELPMTNPAVGM